MKGCLGLFSALFGSVSFRFLTGHLNGDLHGVRRCIFDLDLLPFTLVEQLLGQTSAFLVLTTLLSSLTFDFELSGFSMSFAFTAFTLPVTKIPHYMAVLVVPVAVIAVIQYLIDLQKLHSSEGLNYRQIFLIIQELPQRTFPPSQTLFG